MSLDNYHLSFLKSLYSAENGVGLNSTSNGFGLNSTESSPTTAQPTIESLLEPFGFQSSQADFAAALAQLTGQSVKQMDRQQSATTQRPTSFASSSLFGTSEFGNPLGAPGTPIGSQMSIGQSLLGGSSPFSTPQLTPMATPNGAAPPPKNPKLYKTELCRSWMDHGRCNYGERCQYAHGEVEKRPVPRHPKYKTEACQSFHQSGYCPYGPRCHFIHNEPPSQYSTPVSTPVSQPNTPSLYASQYHNVNMKQQQQQQTQSTGGVPNSVLQRVYSLPNGGYGSAGESPPCSSNDSGSESPNGSFSPGLDLDDNGPFSAGFLSASPHKMQQQKTAAAPRVQTNRFLSYDQSNISDNQFSNLLNDICQWNIDDSLSTTFPGFLTSKWSTTAAEESSPAPTSSVTTPGRLPVFAQLSNPQ